MRSPLSLIEMIISSCIMETIGAVDLSNQTPFLKALIADGCYLNAPAWGTVRSLKEARDISH